MATERYLRFEQLRRPSNGRSLLWPVHVWKVLYPSTKRIGLNLFQEAILGLSRAQCRDRNEIASLLNLDPQLIAFIIATQLIPNEWMDERGFITQLGERVLEEAQDIRDDIRVGYAYQDAITGRWIPRFTDDLPEIEAEETDDRGFPIFRGSRDSGKRDAPFVLKHKPAQLPDINELFEAYQRFRTDISYAKQGDDRDELPTNLHIKSVTCLDDAPQAMWLWTWAYSDPASGQPWLITDPFGIQRAASWLRKSMEDLLDSSSGASKYISGVVGQSNAQSLSASDWWDTLKTEVDLELMSSYSWLAKVPSVQEYLSATLRRKAAIVRLDYTPQEDINSLVMEVSNLAESVLQWMLETYPADIRRLPHYKVQTEWKMGQAKQTLSDLNLGCLDEDSLSRLCNQELSRVRTAISKRNSSLKALVFANLLATLDRPTHPFKTISAEKLALSALLDMTDARNKKVGHSGSKKITKDDALAYADFLINWIQHFEDWFRYGKEQTKAQ